MSEARSERPRVPMWVGAIGHRSLRPDDDAELRRAVGNVLDDIERRWGAGLEPRLLTSLAEGADQLVAEEARARGWPLSVPLPLPQSLYEADFRSHASLSTFRRLRDEAASCFEVGLADGVSIEDVREAGDSREKQYARAGRLVAETCPILIALWDGEDRKLTGGTSELVTQVLQGRQEDGGAANQLNPPQPKLVYHIWTPSPQGSDTTGIPFDCRILSSVHEGETGSAANVLDDILARMREFDVDIANELRGAEPEIRRSSETAIPAVRAEALPAPIRDGLRWFALADALALRYQRRVWRALPALLLLAFLAFAGFELFAHVEHGRSRRGLEVFGFCFAAAIAVFGWVRWRAHERKFLDYRALAEGLRVQLFWGLCGLFDSVSEHYLRRHRGELSWIPTAVAGLSLGTGLAATDDEGSDWPLGRRRRLARDHWLESQRDFFAAKSRSAALRARIGQWTARVLLFTAIAIVVGLWIESGSGATHEPFHTIAIVGGGLLLAASAALRHFVERRAYETHARRYELMHLLVSRALRAVGDDKASLEGSRAAEVFREFGRESLAENGDWLLLHRERPLEVPSPS
jgi:hypothetical protein